MISEKYRSESTAQKIRGLLPYVNFDQWGKNGKKSLRHFVEEIRNKETKLVPYTVQEISRHLQVQEKEKNKDKVMVREIKRVNIQVLFRDVRGNTWQLIEKVQHRINEDGTITPVFINRPVYGIREKMREKESLDSVLVRAMKEETDNKISIPLEKVRERFERQEGSPITWFRDEKNYPPGLITRAEEEYYKIWFTQEEFQKSQSIPTELLPEGGRGFVEDQPGEKTVVFRWEKVA